MRLAFLSDIHGNLPALTSALSSAGRHGAGRIVAAGDVVGTGPYPVECIRLLRNRGIPSVLGNVDRRVFRLRGRPGVIRLQMGGMDKPDRAWTASQLGEAEWEWLAGLPRRLELTVNGVSILVVHGSPRGLKDRLYPSITARALEPRLDTPKPRVLVCGHTHIPFAKTVAGVRVVNCGSVGRPVDGDPRGSYALLDVSEDGSVVHARIVRFSWAVETLERDLAARGVPGVGLADVLGVAKAGGDS